MDAFPRHHPPHRHRISKPKTVGALWVALNDLYCGVTALRPLGWRLHRGWRWVVWVCLALGTVVVFASGHSTPREYPKRKLVRFWHRWQGDWEKQVQKIVDAFN